MHLAHLNIGSNCGDRRANIARAVALLSGRFTVTGLSDIVESAPWGYDSTHSFLNIGISLLTDLEPLELLDATQAIERAVGQLPHRNPDSSYRDRDIDIDIIFIDDIVMSTPRLTLPHPLATRRDFVMTPLRQLHPDKTL